ncbi:hypothetical protein V8C37DRAFT_1308 [Trichoderma ceciliae]
MRARWTALKCLRGKLQLRESTTRERWKPEPPSLSMKVMLDNSNNQGILTGQPDNQERQFPKRRPSSRAISSNWKTLQGTLHAISETECCTPYKYYYLFRTPYLYRTYTSTRRRAWRVPDHELLRSWRAFPCPCLLRPLLTVLQPFKSANESHALVCRPCPRQSPLAECRPSNHSAECIESLDSSPTAPENRFYLPKRPSIWSCSSSAFNAGGDDFVTCPCSATLAWQQRRVFLTAKRRGILIKPDSQNTRILRIGAYFFVKTRPLLSTMDGLSSAKPGPNTGGGADQRQLALCTFVRSQEALSSYEYLHHPNDFDSSLASFRCSCRRTLARS